MKAPRTVAVVLAGGSGQRAGGAKQWRRAAGKSLLWHACSLFAGLREIGGLVVVVPQAEIARAEQELSSLPRPRWRQIVAGGKTRHLSSRAGLGVIPNETELVLIHDAARPFASPALVRRLLRAAKADGAAVPVMPVVDSTLMLGAHDQVERYLPRPRLRAVQTPQAFRRSILSEAMRRRPADHADDAGWVHAAGHPVSVVEGEATNQKITTAAEVSAALRRLAREGS